MNEMRKLMEAVQLNEYLLRKGQSIKTLLQLNVFNDTGHGEDSIVYGPNDISWEEGEIDPDLQQEWLGHVKPYVREAGQLKKEIVRAAARGRKLTDVEATAGENTWYDGSDLYSDLELAFDELPEVWDNQIEIVREILQGDIQDEEGDYAAFGEANQGGKTEHSGAKKGKGAYYGRKKDAKQDSKKNRRNADKAETKQLNEFEDFGFRDPADLLSSFDEELDTLLNNYWSNAEIIGNTPEEIAAIQQKLEVLLGEFITKSTRG